MSARIVMATCRAYPDLSKSNLVLADALKAAGATLLTAPWNGPDQASFHDNDLVLLRQTWDYMDDPGGFAAWALWLDRAGARIETAPGLAIWNNDKRTLSALGDAGFAVPHTLPAEPADGFRDICGDRLVIKPVFGGSGVGVRLSTPATREADMAAAMADMPGRTFLVQDYLPGIRDGEWKMTCIGSRVAFALRLVPAAGEFRVNSRFGPQIAPADPPAAAVEGAEAILDWLHPAPVLARVDGVMQDGRFVCTELELCDPDLGFHLVPRHHAGAAAQAVLAAL